MLIVEDLLQTGPVNRTLMLRLKKKNTAIPSESPCFVVREMRLELTRRLTHAPQTCLSTYSSTLASAPKGKSNYTHERDACQEGIFLCFAFSCLRHSRSNCTEKTDQRKGKSHNQSCCSVVHQKKIAHLQISVVAEKRGKLDQQRRRKVDRNGECQNQGENIRSVEIAFMHVGQKKRNPDGKEQTQCENGPVVQPLAADPGDSQQIQHIEKGENNTGNRRRGWVLNVGEDGEHRRRVIIQPASDAAGLIKIQSHGLPERPPETDCRKNHEKISS